jgi:hypothetical protein
VTDGDRPEHLEPDNDNDGADGEPDSDLRYGAPAVSCRPQRARGESGGEQREHHRQDAHPARDAGGELRRAADVAGQHLDRRRPVDLSGERRLARLKRTCQHGSDVLDRQSERALVTVEDRPVDIGDRPPEQPTERRPTDDRGDGRSDQRTRGDQIPAARQDHPVGDLVGDQRGDARALQRVGGAVGELARVDDGPLDVAHDEREYGRCAREQRECARRDAAGWACLGRTHGRDDNARPGPAAPAGG